MRSVSTVPYTLYLLYLGFILRIGASIHLGFILRIAMVLVLVLAIAYCGVSRSRLGRWSVVLAIG